MKLQDIVMLFRSNQVIAPSPAELVNMAGMRERNEARMNAIKAAMGEKWILHPSHMKTKLDEPRPA